MPDVLVIQHQSLTEQAPLEERRAGDLEAEDRNQHRILTGQPGNASRFLPEGKHQRLEAEGSQPGRPKAEDCIRH